MNNIENLYRQVIMDHYKNPRNKGLKGYPHVHLKNPSCGDDITIEANLVDGKIKEVRHQGSGCSICCSSASVLTEVMSGKSVDEGKQIIEKYFSMMKGEEISDEEVFKTVFADKDYAKLGWSSSTLDFTPVEKGAYIVKCEVVDGAANSVEAYSAIVKVEGGITKAQIARVQVWFENNWKSLIFLGIALLSLIGIIVLLFVKPKEEKELEENTTAK